ncbi:YitT family protein [Bacteroidetes/Chlorobi group bacterium ChocPot_Mid]|nr:MAG: YitT family protein [Bacteroidetes/Chlorobi group bacterium ChocPot_Mid]
MNPFLFNIAYKIASMRSGRYKKLKNQSSTEETRKTLVSFSYYFSNTIYILLGAFSAGFGLKGFLLPNGFIDGGVTGISLLVSIKTGFSLPLLILLINIPFFIFGFTQIGKWFVVKSILAIGCLALVLFAIDFPVMTNDKLLVSVFGGFFLGAGIGLSIRGGAVIDGTEILAIFTSKKMGFTVGDFIAGFNILLFIVAAYLLSVEQALYAILTYLAASKTADFVIEGVEEYTGVHIVSEYSDEIRWMIINKLGRGVTVLTGKRGFSKEGEEPEPIEMLYTVMTRLELQGLKKEVQKIDPKAFMTMVTINDIKGGMIKKRTIKD